MPDIDLAAIKARASARAMFGIDLTPGDFQQALAASTADVRPLVAEVERLRGEIAHYEATRLDTATLLAKVARLRAVVDDTVGLPSTLALARGLTAELRRSQDLVARLSLALTLIDAGPGREWTDAHGGQEALEWAGKIAREALADDEETRT